MTSSRIKLQTSRWLEDSVLTTDVSRALRSSLALAIAWAACLATGHAGMAFVVAPTAQNVALLDVRGDYRARLAILLMLTGVAAVSVLAGAMTGESLTGAMLAIGSLALLAGCWRHLSGDYGPHFALASGLLFFIALSHPGDGRHAHELMTGTVLGGLTGIAVQLTGWFVRPQHAVRHAVAEAWVAASDLITAMRAETDDGEPCLRDVSEKEGAMRATVDRTLDVLKSAGSGKKPQFIAHLDTTAQLAARLTTRTTAFYTAIETLRPRIGFGRVAPALDSSLRSLASLARSAALVLITHRPDGLLALEVRRQRAQDLLRVLDCRLAALDPADTEVTQARQLLALVAELLPLVHTALAETVDHGAANSGFSLRLPELGGLSTRELGAWLNPPAQPDWMLVRYTLRAAAVLMLAVGAYLYFNIPRGYWIAFTALVVLQPDYGATRQKALQRIVGTLAGSVLASLLLWVKLPVGAHVALAAVMASGFALFLRRNYGLAVFFVTLMIVLMTEAMMPVHLDFTVARLLSTLAGGALALLAAVLFWPKWEQEQSPTILADALRANGKYLAAVAAKLPLGEPFSGDAILTKREAERANSRAAASLQRLLGEPARLQVNVEQTAALTTYNQRLTRAITVLGQHLNRRVPVKRADIDAGAVTLGGAIESLAARVEGSQPPAVIPLPELEAPAGTKPEEAVVYGQLGRVATELEAMALVPPIQGGAPSGTH